MIIDFRYHIITIVAIFLALSLGILIGANTGKPFHAELQNQMVRIEKTYATIRANQKQLQDSLKAKEKELSIAKKFQSMVLPNLITNSLQEQKIAILRTNNSVDFKHLKVLVDYLEQAGAEITSITTFNQPLKDLDDPLRLELTETLEISAPNDENDFLQEVFTKIFQIITRGEEREKLQLLRDKDLLQLWGNYKGEEVTKFIFFGGSMNAENNHQKEIDAFLFEAARYLKVAVIGVEPGFVSESYMNFYQTKVATTIDNIDTLPGIATLVYALFSGKTGHYGVKDTARKLIPDFKIDY